MSESDNQPYSVEEPSATKAPPYTLTYRVILANGRQDRVEARSVMIETDGSLVFFNSFLTVRTLVIAYAPGVWSEVQKE